MPTWLGQVVSQADYDRLRDEYEERWFARQSSQGQLCAPMVITDGQPALRSMTDGKIYDSKSNMRREYKRAGVEEVGTEKQIGRTWMDEKAKRAKQRSEIKASLHKAHSQMGFGAV
jgi:hypothetical protein